MGGNSSSTPQNVGSQLSGLFMNNTGYQPMQDQAQLPPITAPQYGLALNPSPEQAAAATMARMQARTPMAAPVSAPVKPSREVIRGNANGLLGLGGSGR